MRGIVTGPEPNVIDEELCRKCIAAVRTKPGQSADSQQEAKKEPAVFREVSQLQSHAGTYFLLEY